jgi:hypothetical protein
MKGLDKKIVGILSTIVFLNVILTAPVHASQTFSGTEDNIVDITPIKGPSILTFTYTGEGVFSATPVEENGKEGFPYQLKIGDFSGTYFQRTPTKPIVAMAVKGAGEWSVTINSLKSASPSSAKSGSGSGTNVINLGKATSGIKRITWSHTGDGVFSVTPIDTKGKPKFPLFLKIGNYSGTVMLPSGTQYFEVKADGPWNYSIK